MAAKKAELVRWTLDTPGLSGPWKNDIKPSDHSKPGAELIFRSEYVIDATRGCFPWRGRKKRGKKKVNTAPESCSNPQNWHTRDSDPGKRHIGKKESKDFPCGLVVRLHPSNAGGMGSIYGQGNFTCQEAKKKLKSAWCVNLLTLALLPVNCHWYYFIQHPHRTLWEVVQHCPWCYFIQQTHWSLTTGYHGKWCSQWFWSQALESSRPRMES